MYIIRCVNSREKNPNNVKTTSLFVGGAKQEVANHHVAVQRGGVSAGPGGRRGRGLARGLLSGVYQFCRPTLRATPMPVAVAHCILEET